MRAGRLYHRVEFYAKVTVRDNYNSSIDTWPTATITTRGEVMYSGGGKTLSSEEKFYSQGIILTVRYRDTITETMRVKIDDKDYWYEITNIEEIGRKEALRLILEKINT
jgi:head-tail adaptor